MLGVDPEARVSRLTVFAKLRGGTKVRSRRGEADARDEDPTPPGGEEKSACCKKSSYYKKSGYYKSGHCKKSGYCQSSHFQTSGGP